MHSDLWCILNFWVRKPHLESRNSYNGIQKFKFDVAEPKRRQITFRVLLVKDLELSLNLEITVHSFSSHLLFNIPTIYFFAPICTYLLYWIKSGRGSALPDEMRNYSSIFIYLALFNAAAAVPLILCSNCVLMLHMHSLVCLESDSIGVRSDAVSRYYT